MDIGANHGMIALHGASLMGTSGRVDAIELNSSCYHRIREQQQLNALSHMNVHQVAASDEAGRCELKTVPGHTGFSTLGAVTDTDRRAYSKSFDVQVVRADDLLGEDSKTVSVVKIDVEGYECHALRGLTRTIETHRPILVCELSRYCLEWAGSSAEALFAIMAPHGYRGFEISHATSSGFYTLALRSADHASQVPDGDMAWVHPEDSRMQWLTRFVREGHQTAMRAA